MDWSVIPAEYEMPPERTARTVGRWLIGLAIVSLIIGASLALVTGTESESSVEVEISN